MSDQHRNWGSESGGCQLSISTNKARFRRGEPVNLDIVFRNNGRAPVGLARVSEWFDFEWRVQRMNGTMVPLSTLGKQRSLALQAGGGGTLFRVAAGEQVAFSMNLAEIFDLAQGGEIEIQVVRKALDSGGTPFQVVSNSTKIVIET